MAVNVPEEFVAALLAALTPAADACELNGPCFYMLALAAAALDKAPVDLTLAEVAELVEAAGRRYNGMCERLRED